MLYAMSDVHGDLHALEGMFPWSKWLEVDPGFETFRSLVRPDQWDFFQRGGRLNILAWDEKDEAYAQWDNGWRREILSKC